MGCCCLQKLKDVDDIDERLTESRVRLSSNNEALVLKEQGKWYVRLRERPFQKESVPERDQMLHSGLGKNRLNQNKNPNELVYYTNLALAYKANSQF
jgi:hypothetical protein